MDGNKIDNSQVTPATGTRPDNKPIADSLANKMPTADSPTRDSSLRSDPDKIIPGPEAASGVDSLEEEKTLRDREKDQGRGKCF